MSEISFQLESVLVHWIEDELRRAGRPAFARGRVLEAVRSVLSGQGLDREERELLRGCARAGDSSWVLRLVERRLQRAIEAGLEVVQGESQGAQGTCAPAVLVGDPDTLSPTTDVARSLLERSSESLRVQGEESGALPGALPQRRVLVLADERVTETLTSGESAALLEDLEHVDVAFVAQGLKELADRMRARGRSESGDGLGAQLPDEEPADLLIGHLFHGKYRIESCLGQGGFGRVYRATEARVGYPVAIKVLRPELRGIERHVRQFMEEARRLFSLEHENIGGWKVFDVTPEGDCYFVMELLQGEELAALLEREGRLDARRAGRILLQVLRALEKAHFLSDRESILHLDLKPKNVFLVPGDRPGQERVKVIDFGIGQLIRRQEDDRSGEQGGEAEQGGAGGAEGEQRITGLTIDYASPEQCAYMMPMAPRLPLDGRSDLFSLGVMGFRMLTGELPFPPLEPDSREGETTPGGGRSPSVYAKLKARLELPCRKLASTGVRVPRRLAAFVDRCLELDRERRPPDSRAALAELKIIVEPPLSRRLIPVAAVALSVTAVAAAGAARWFAPPGDPAFGLLDTDNIKLSEDLPLFLGGPRREAVLRTAPKGKLGQGDDLELVVEQGEPPLPPGWQAELEVGSDVLRLVVPADSPSLARLVRIRGPERLSDVFRLIVLGDDAWRIAAPRLTIERGEAQPLDPRDVEVLLPLTVADEVVHEQWLSEARLNWSRATDRSGRLPAEPRDDPSGLVTSLSGLAGLEGIVRLTWEVSDQVGRSLELDPLDLALVGGPLDLRTLELQGHSGPADDGAAELWPTSQRVSFEVNRPCEVRLEVLDEDGTLLLEEGPRSVDAGQDSFDLPPLFGTNRSEPFAGTLRVSASERGLVACAPQHVGDRTDEETLAFRIRFPEPFEPTLAVRPASPPDAGPAPVVGGVSFVRDPRLRVAISRPSDVPVAASLSLRKVEPPGERALSPEPPVATADSNAWERTLDLEGEGLYRLEVQLHLFDPLAREPAPLSLGRAEQLVVLDENPPRVAFRTDFAEEGWPAFWSAEELEQPRIRVGVEDDLPGGIEPPSLVVEWTLGPEDSDEQPEVARGFLEARSGEEPSLPLGDIAANPLPVGRYELVVRAFDAAGNPSEPSRLGFLVACRGPWLEFAWRDQPREPWIPEQGRFPLRVRAFHPRGVRSVSAALEATGEPSLPRREAVALRPLEGELWGLDLVFGVAWSTRTVRIDLQAEDEAGGQALLGPIERRLASISESGFDLLRMRPPGEAFEVSPMRLVRGNAGTRLPYVFGGRQADVENEEAERVGLGPLSERSWQIDYGPGEIEDFYLDRDEVSIAQYLAFVRAEGGYARRSWWPQDSAPDPARTRELAQALEQSVVDGRGEHPVTSVCWPEAWAYARWVGKRLPSLVELEYATRGGLAYRLWSASDRPGATPREDVNYNPDGEYNPDDLRQHSTWPRDAGADETSATGLRHLCGNVSEWTASAAPTGLGRDREHARGRRARMLRPDEETAASYYVFGGSFESLAADALRFDKRKRDELRPAIGFRCALSFSELPALVGGSTGGERFEVELSSP